MIFFKVIVAVSIIRKKCVIVIAELQFIIQSIIHFSSIVSALHIGLHYTSMYNIHCTPIGAMNLVHTYAVYTIHYMYYLLCINMFK